VLANGINEPHYTKVSYIKTIKIMRLFAALRKIREFERTQLPFLESIVDFDIVIEIGYAEEEQHPLTLKTLLLLNLSSRTTVRRRLAQLIEQGIVRRRRNANDQRSSLLTISSSNLKLLERYVGALISICASIK
jgi:DNA-binding MarR family transcriptional regulator